MTNPLRLSSARDAAVIPIFTFVNDFGLYRDMRLSFREAGFTLGRACFFPLESDSHGVRLEPYSTITALVSDVHQPFFILCHQDVRLDQGARFQDFSRAVTEVQNHDPHWAIIGNAGGLRSLRVVRRITDPTGGSTSFSLPARVHSLDENFLVIRSGTHISCSPELEGFHFYATDFCLNALERGRCAYVIDFHLRHLSAGRRDDAYYAARQRFIDHWSSKFRACYVRTTIEVLFFSRRGVLMKLFGYPRVCKVLKNHPLIATLFGVILGRRTGRGLRARIRSGS